MNQGHTNLLNDLRELLKRAEAFEFDDFKSPHATPKVMLDREFRQMAEHTRNGRYD